ncbi:MAG: valine--tRNA ligase, partial [Solirubrobacterales bacterium]|nr:valine--tRNA ligase [Solirubrobacterales bacterium]
MRMDELAAPALQVVRDGRVRIHPDSQRRRYDEWLSNIRPWCISRQIWWGHQLPVWYRGEETYVGTEPPEGDGWERDPDVLDTWFSSALWPFATLGWPDDTPELRAFYPTDVLSTARDILFLWVARMVMMGLEFTGDVPFHDVYVHSVIQSPDGRRMSKSLGTGVDPLALIEGGPRPPAFSQGGDFPAYGADAVRFGLLAMSSTQDVRFSEEKVAQGQALGNKLFNAAKFVVGKVPEGTVPAPRPTTVEDRWILSRLQAVKADSARRLGEFDFHKLALGLYDYVYGELCDWYLELIKGREVDADLAATLLHVLRESVALVHPVMPFVTEDLWANLPGHDGRLLAASELPVVDEALRDPVAETQVATLIEAVTTVRSWRNEAGVQAGAFLDARLMAEGYDDTRVVLARLARLQLADDPAAPAASAIVIPGGTVDVLASGSFDPAEAQRKAQAQAADLRKEIARAEGKLSNAGFTDKAPAPVVRAERDKLERLRGELAHLGEAS